MNLPGNTPIGTRASIDHDLLQSLEAHYAVGPIQTSRDLGGAYNLNVYLHTTTGNYVARVYRPWVKAGRLNAVQGVRAWLGERGIPTIQPLSTIDDATFAIVQERLIEVEPYIAHSTPQETWTFYEHAFLLLGHLHNALAQYPQPGAMPPPMVENYATPDLLREWTTITLQKLQQAEDQRGKEATYVTEKALRIIEPLQEQWRQMKAHLPLQLVHGDYGTGNLLWTNRGIAAVVDFDFLAYHERIFDIAYALFWMFTRMQPGSAAQDWAWQRASGLIDVYNKVNHAALSQEERLALPLEIARVPLYWIAEAAFLENPVEAVLSQIRGLEASEWLIHHTNDLPLRLAGPGPRM